MNAKIFLLSLCFFLPFALLSQESESFENAEKTPPIQYTLLLEGGINTASPVSVAGEFVFMHGITIHKKHLLALAFGIGGGYIESYKDDEWTNNPFYMPIYFTYRYYFSPDKKFTPMLSSSLGGLVNYQRNSIYGYNNYVYAENKWFGGCYASLSAGFRVKKFYLLGGLNFTPMKSNIRQGGVYPMDYPYPYYGSYYKNQWIFPVGLTLHIGITF
jgi:hypothetical protein